MRMISKNGLKAPYIQEMIARRMSWYGDMMRGRFTLEKFHEFKRKVYQDYEKYGVTLKRRDEAGRSLWRRDAKGRFVAYFPYAFWDYFDAYKADKSTWWRNPDWYDDTPKPEDYTKPKTPKAQGIAKQLEGDIARLDAERLRALQRGDTGAWHRIQREIDTLREKRQRL